LARKACLTRFALCIGALGLYIAASCAQVSPSILLPARKPLSGVAGSVALWPNSLVEGASGNFVVGGDVALYELTPDGQQRVLGGQWPLVTLGSTDRPADLANLRSIAGLTMLAGEKLAFTVSTQHIVAAIDSSGIVRRWAGQPFVSGWSGDGGNALDAVLENPGDMEQLPDGRLILIDGHYRVRVMEVGGTIEHFAGDGTASTDGYGDGGPAVDARFGGLRSLAVMPDGSVVLADSGAGRIRLVEPGGTISTIAGRAFFPPDADGDGGPAVDALIGQPTAVAVSSLGEVYLADSWNGLIRKIDLDGIITTVAGTGTPGYSGDGGPALAAQIGQVTDLLFASSVDLILADNSTRRVRRIDTSGRIETIAGNGYVSYGGDGRPVHDASFERVTDVAALRSGALLVADTFSNRLRIIDTQGRVAHFAGTGSCGLVSDGELASESSLCAETVVEGLDSTIYALDGFATVYGIAPDGTVHRVAGTSTRGFNGQDRPATSTWLDRPRDLAVSPVGGELYIADTDNRMIRRVDDNGFMRLVAGTGEFGSTGDGGLAVDATITPRGICFDAQGSLWIVDAVFSVVRRIDVTTGVIERIAGGHGNGYLGDGGPAIDAQLSHPVSVYVAPAGDVYIADLGNFRIRRIDAAGVMSTFAGNGRDDFTGEGLPLLETSLGYTERVRPDHDGNLLVGALSGWKIILDGSSEQPASGLSAELNRHSVVLRWNVALDHPTEYRVLRSHVGQAVSEERGTGLTDGRGSYTYVDDIKPGDWDYELSFDQGGGPVLSLGPVRLSASAPSFQVSQWPNPFRGASVVQLQMDRAHFVEANLYDVRGRRVRELADGRVGPGVVRWDLAGVDGNGQSLASGVYFLRILRDGGDEQVLKLVHLR